MTIKSFFYIPELCGLIHLPLWGYLGTKGKLNLNRVRNGEPKYIIREAFEILYKNDNVDLTNKIPFTRPTDIYMNKYTNRHIIMFKYISIVDETNLIMQFHHNLRFLI